MRDWFIKKATSRIGIIICCALAFTFVIAMKYKPDSSDKSYTLLALGDSYTIGEQVPAKENFPNQVVTMLDEKKISFKPATIVAKTGWTTDELQAGIHTAKLKRKYDFVTLLIGVNNQYRGKKVVDYLPDFEALLRQSIRFAGGDSNRVIVLSIPDWSVTPFAKDRNKDEISKAIDEYNAANKLIAEKFHVHYINITTSTRKAADDPTLLAADGLHPSGKEYQKWAEEVAAIIKKAL